MDIIVIACAIGIGVGIGLFRIANAIQNLADNIGKVSHEIHIHAETMNEIKHDGIGIDKNMTPGEKFVSDIMRGKKVK